MFGIERYVKQVEKTLAEHRHAERQVKEERRRLVLARRHTGDVAKAQQVIQHAAQQVQRLAHKRLASVVGRCLTAVFDEPYQFAIHFDRKRGRTEARFTFSRGGMELSAKDVGGGVVEVAALALRLACLILTRPAPRRLLVLDEPLKNLHGEQNQERAAALITTLAREMKVQFVVVTGLKWLEIGKVVHVSKNRGPVPVKARAPGRTVGGKGLRLPRTGGRKE